MKEFAKWSLLIGLVGAILYLTIGLGFGIRIGQAAEGDWIRVVPIMRQIPVEQQGMSDEELADMDTVKIIHKYTITQNAVGIVYYDEKTQMNCHVLFTATLLDPRGISCSPAKPPSK